MINKSLLIIVFILISSTICYGQQININNSFSAQELIENNLVQGCVQVSNVTSPINGSVNGFSSFGYFEKSNSNFPFQNGILLSTGNANSAGNIENIEALNEGDNTWLNDSDLETALGITNTVNATAIEFDFISVANQIQFNYILASEEYYREYPCLYSDGFAFLIKLAGTNDPYTNIAIIPNTNIPVNTNTIHDEIVGFCDAENEQYFEGYNVGDTNFNGRTVVMSASTPIQPNVSYHIKLVIADQTDRNFDSAVFIEGNSFNDTVELGSDITTCDSNITLNADIGNPQASFSWFQDGILMPGEVMSSLNVSNSGDYTVEISIPLNNTTCLIQDIINVQLNTVQQGFTLSDFEQCDDASNNGSEVFDLTTRTPEALALVPPGNYDVTYHYSNSSAVNGTNPQTAISNTTNPQTVYVRIEDTDTGCLSIASFNLIVNPFPIINNPQTYEVCQNEASQVDLTENDDQIINSNPNLTVTYHEFQSDAQTGTNPLSSPYEVTGSSSQLFVRVVDINTNCVAFTTLDINVLPIPQINPDIQVIDACEQDDDGFEPFDLSSVIDDVLQGLTNVTTSFHITEADAQTGANPIPNITNFINTEPDFQLVYIRVVGQNGCASTIGVELHTFILETGTQIQDFRSCDTDNDGILNFDLQNIESTIVGDLLNVDVIFYETETDRTNTVNALDELVLYEVDTTQTLYITLVTPDCTHEDEIELIVNFSFTIPPLNPVDYCDTDQDGLTLVDLTVFDAYVSGTITSSTVKYFDTEQDAIDNINDVSTQYTNTTNPFTIYARVRDSQTGCSATTPLEINILNAPLANQPSDFIICDDDQDGITIINLNDKNNEIINNINNFTFSFYLSENDANLGSNNITTPDSFSTNTQTIYCRVENQTTTCHSVVLVEIIVNTLPQLPNISNFRNCESDGNQIADFIFSEKDLEILNGLTDKDVLYFETQADALNRTNIIDKTVAYQNTQQNQIIHVRVENLTDPNCFEISFFQLEIGSNPIYNIPQDWPVCDDNSNDQLHTFDLNEVITEISANSPDTLNITFYTSLIDAENGSNSIPLNYTNTVNPQPIFAVIDNGTYCKGLESFELSVIQVPEVNNASALRDCDTDTDGSIVFDLTVSEIEVLQIRQDNVVVSYFETLNDLENNTNVINSPEAYTNISNPQTVYIQILNTVSNCSAIVSLDLIVDLPPSINNIPVFSVCEQDGTSYDLTQTIIPLIGNQSDVNTTFYANQNDAELAQNPLNTNYTYNTSNDTIFIRAENTITNCFNIASFNLQIDPTPIANMPNDLESCDDDYDGLFVFDLSQQSATILGSQNPADFNVTYFETQADAIANTNGISELIYEAFDGENFYVRVENVNTGCFNTTNFSALIYRKPIVEITDQVICLDNLPLIVSAETNEPTDSYLWSNNETTSIIEITDIGTYSVTVTSAFGCSTSSTFSVTESEQADIEFTETVDFADPNSITINVNGIGDYLYQLDDGTPQESNVFEPVTIGPHTITVIDANGCSSVSRDVVVIDAPKFVTPNGDGYFDTWHITGVSQLPGTIVTVYDRYGKLITVLTHNSYGWDGRYNGNLMPANDYWFVANVVYGDKKFDVKGHFALRL